MPKFYFSGFATNTQKYPYLTLGFLFWMTIILLTNFIGLKDIGPRYTFKTLNCGRNLKQCLQDFPYEDCYRSFSTCMREEKDFVYPSSNVTILERKTKPIEETFTKEEQEVNLKRCERLNLYGKTCFLHLLK